MQVAAPSIKTNLLDSTVGSAAGAEEDASTKTPVKTVKSKSQKSPKSRSARSQRASGRTGGGVATLPTLPTRPAVETGGLKVSSCSETGALLKSYRKCPVLIIC